MFDHGLHQIIGLYLLIMAVIMLGRAPFFRERVMHLRSDSGSILMFASISLILGLCLVVTHNLWYMNWDMLVTVIGWVVVVKSIGWLAFPEAMILMSRRIYSGVGFYALILLMTVLGFLLLSRGIGAYL